MRKILLLLASLLAGLFLLAPAASAQSTYSYVGTTYDAIPAPVGPATFGTQKTYTPAMSVTGSFTTAAPLAPNLVSQNIGPLITSYSFSDGISTFASTDPNARKAIAVVNTNASGQITTATFSLFLWQTNGPRSTALASADSRFDVIFIGALGTGVDSNRNCLTLGTSSAGDNDNCTSSNDVEKSSASSSTAGVWTSPAPATIPTMSEWAMILLGLILAGAAMLVLQRRMTA